LLKMKDIFTSYCEEHLHILYSYRFLAKKIMPILILLFSFFCYDQIAIIVLLSQLSIMTTILLEKNIKLASRIYSFEITAINDLINEKYSTNIDTDFEELGVEYLKKLNIHYLW
jgi:hypothetical protein